MTLSGQKTAILYDFYRENGFSNSIDTIAATLNISKKTFFNRYGSKYNSIVMAFGHWFSILEGRWLEIQGHCNNAVEELVMFMYATKKTMVEERHYYDLILKERCFLKNKAFFKDTLITILGKGKQKFYVHDSLDMDMYSDFLLNNLFLIDVEEDKRPEMLRYVLSAALTERGMEILSETPFGSH